MNEPLLKRIRDVACWTHPASDTERGIGKKRMPFAARVAVCLLLIGVLLPAALCVAAQQGAYVITTTAGAGGSIYPLMPAVNHGSSQTFTITPKAGYRVADLKVDGISVGAVTTYSLNNVTATHTISATFVDTREAAIAAELAAGTDFAVIIKNAVNAGMSVDNAVRALVTAGADPGKVTFDAITAKFDPSAVTQGAANGVAAKGLSDAAVQGQMATIVQAATQAGATPTQTNTGLSNASVPSTVIANANAIAASSPVFGYAALPSAGAAGSGVGSGLPVMSGGAGGSGGGGGGGVNPSPSK